MNFDAFPYAGKVHRIVVGERTDLFEGVRFHEHQTADHVRFIRFSNNGAADEDVLSVFRKIGAVPVDIFGADRSSAWLVQTSYDEVIRSLLPKSCVPSTG